MGGWHKKMKSEEFGRSILIGFEREPTEVRVGISKMERPQVRMRSLDK